MNFRALKYMMVITASGLGVLSLWAGGWWTYILPIYAFVLIPALELVLPADTHNMTKAEEEVVRHDRIYDWMLYLVVPMQWGLLGYFLYRVSSPGLQPHEIGGMIFTFCLACGVFGINVAHELGHRHTWYEKVMAKALLLSTIYMHFIIEHNRGHHRWVSTDHDPASSRYGEWVYGFWFRSILGGTWHAWQLEVDRVRKAGHSIWNPVHNEMIRFFLMETSLVVGILLLFNWQVMLYYLAAAVIGWLLLETVNYIEHYGLRRKKLGEHYYEKVLPVHSWNSNHVVGRLLLFELSRHSDHHYHPGRKYQVLRHFDDSPQMPTGYPGMIVLALFPPLWFAVMHPHIARLRQQNQTAATALA